jgi:uncharacterized protein (DUF885 family)
MAKRVVRVVLALLAVLLVGASIFFVNLIWFRPFSLDLFYEKVFAVVALEDPELLSQIGLAEQFGYRAHDRHLRDVSVARTLADQARTRKALADLRAYDPAKQSPSQRLSTRVLTWFLETQLEGERFAFHNYPVNQLFGVQNGTPDFLLNIHRIDDRRGADEYLSRLGEVARKLDQAVDSLRYREQHGVVPPRFVIDRVLVETRAFAGKPPRENPLYTHLAAKLEKLPGVPAEEQQRLLAGAEKAITESVIPAYRRLIAFLEEQQPKATSDDGVWKLPDGDAYYAWRLHSQTSTRMSPQEVHQLGLSEVARIEGEMKAIFAAQGLGDGAPAELLQRLSKEQRFLYPNDEKGRQAALAEYRQLIAVSLERSRGFFGLLPKAKVEVQRVPEFKEKTAPGAYYQPPAFDGSRPGVFYANLRNLDDLPRFGMRTLSVHEAVPGHHFQLAVALEQKGLPSFRRLLPFTAYTEGWALYAERLAKEMGLYQDDPFGDLGRLQAEMFRAVRLVVDTGIHYKRWTREQAITYMVSKTGMPEGEVVAEIERYIVEPGQACAYKLGMLKLLELRARAEKELGPRFDLKAFHDLVLGGGALPLDLLEEQVQGFIAARKG